MARRRDGTGLYMYVPKPAVEELNHIMQSKQVEKATAFRQMAAYSRVGREAENILKFRFPNTMVMLKRKK